MGYDMHWHERPEGEAEAVAAASLIFNAAVKKRDALERGSPPYEAAHKEVAAAYDAMGDAEVSYFRLNVWGMQEARDLMAARDMLIMVNGPSHEEWLLLPPYIDDHPDDMGGPEYQAAVAELTSRLSMDQPGIPIYKLGSNDGWHVTPIEIQGALAQLERSPLKDEPVEDEWWWRWVLWLKLAVEHGGFQVF